MYNIENGFPIDRDSITYPLTWFRISQDHAPGPCHKLPPIEYGSEDITTLPNGIAIISSSLYGPPHSNLYSFDFNAPDKKVKEITIVGNFKKTDLYPHGIYVWIDKKSGNVTLFLVNHAPGIEAVVVFDYDQNENTLYHKKTITDPLFTSLNDVVAVGPDTFYATNFLTFGYKYILLEKILQLPFANVVFYDGKKSSVVASGLSGANGINVSPDQRTIYVSTSFSQQLHVYSRKEDSSLEAVKVLHVQFDQDWNATIREVYADNGNNFKGSSVASFYGDQMLVGSITGNLLHCHVYAF
ncbi:serum paraoxonase/arylesterase 2-like [Anneissia japonica]|uniref:serum paraoxonase/arylesterase 2-like n=1 Tax=Anneissia japonica TaxID=1529436 RepID=UPI0014255730|nr:serum paraoxonase/arylesterase 2-like [Anneissia japonica]